METGEPHKVPFGICDGRYVCDAAGRHGPTGGIYLSWTKKHTHPTLRSTLQYRARVQMTEDGAFTIVDLPFPNQTSAVDGSPVSFVLHYLPLA